MDSGDTLSRLPLVPIGTFRGKNPYKTVVFIQGSDLLKKVFFFLKEEKIEKRKQMQAMINDLYKTQWRP